MGDDEMRKVFEAALVRKEKVVKAVAVEEKAVVDGVEKVVGLEDKPVEAEKVVEQSVEVGKKLKFGDPGFGKRKWDWEPVRQARFGEMLGAKELSERFGIPIHTINKMAQREAWPSVGDMRRARSREAVRGKGKATADVFDRWIELLKEDLERNVDEIVKHGPTDVRKMDEKEIKQKRGQIALLKDYQDLILAHQTQGAKLRAIERDEYPAEHEVGKVDMVALLGFYRNRPADSEALDGEVIDVSSAAMARDDEVRRLASKPLPGADRLMRVNKVVSEKAGVKVEDE